MVLVLLWVVVGSGNLIFAFYMVYMIFAVIHGALSQLYLEADSVFPS